MTHWGGLFRFGYSQHLSGVKRLLQDPLVADADRNHANVIHLPFKERIHDYVQQTWRRSGRRGWQAGKMLSYKLGDRSENKMRKVLKYAANSWFSSFNKLQQNTGCGLSLKHLTADVWQVISGLRILFSRRVFSCLTYLTLVSETWLFGFLSPLGKIQLVQIRSEEKSKNNVFQYYFYLQNTEITSDKLYGLFYRFKNKQRPHLQHGLDVLWEDRPVQFVSTKRPPDEERSRHPQHFPNKLHPHEVCRDTQAVGLHANSDADCYNESFMYSAPNLTQ